MTPRFRSTAVDVAGVLTVLGEHLYSTPVAALRELVQNAHDSITRRRIEDDDFAGDAGSILVEADVAAGTVRIIDDGSGLTEGEVESCLATIGAGQTGALRRDRPEDERLIGQFGLGFQSAFVLGGVTVTTTSYRTPEVTWRYRSGDGLRYVLDEAPGRARRHRRRGGAQGRAPPARLVGSPGSDPRPLLLPPARAHHGVGHGRAGQRRAAALADRSHRRRGPSGAAPPRRMAFASRFETTFEPLATMPVVPSPTAVRDPGASDAAGILWVQSGGSYGTSDNRRLAVFLRGMLLDDDARDLLPYWAGFVGGVIESGRLMPTASPKTSSAMTRTTPCRPPSPRPS